MLPKSGSRLPNRQSPITESRLRNTIAQALRGELGDTHRAAKTIMGWTGVSDRAARAWLHEESSLSGLHLVMLAANSQPVMVAMLNLMGHGQLSTLIDLAAVEVRLTELVLEIHRLRNDQV